MLNLRNRREGQKKEKRRVPALPPRFSKRTTPLLLFRFANLVARRSIVATVSGGIHTPDTVDPPIFGSIIGWRDITARWLEDAISRGTFAPTQILTAVAGIRLDEKIDMVQELRRLPFQTPLLRPSDGVTTSRTDLGCCLVSQRRNVLRAGSSQ